MSDARARENALAALRHRDFRVFFCGQAVSLLGTWMQQTALGWVIVSLTGSAATIASITFVSSLPLLFFTLGGGVAADRYDRRKILLVTQAALAALAFVYAALLSTDRLGLGLVYLLSLAFGAVVAFDLPAMHALVPELVPPDRIAGAVALNQSLFHGSRLVGPALAGALLAAAGQEVVFFANGLSFLAVIASLAVIRTPPRSERARERSASELGEGLRYIAGHPLLRAVLGYTALTTSLVFPFLIPFMPIAVKNLWGGDARALGLVMSASGLGALFGALTLLRVGAAARLRTMLVFCTIAAAMLFFVSTVSSSWAAAGLVVALSFSVALANGLATTILQVTVPNELRGRVMGVHSFLFQGLMPCSALLLGVLADRIDLRTTLKLMAVAYAALTIPWLARGQRAYRAVMASSSR